MSEEKKKKGMLSRIFSWEAFRGVGKFVFLAVLSWAIMFPADVFADAARSVFVHSAAGEPLVNASWDMLKPVYDFFGFTSDNGIFSSALTDFTAEQTAALTPDKEAVENMIEEGVSSATDMFAPSQP